MPRRTVAILGASADRSKFGNNAVRAYRRRRREVYPVNPRGGEIEGLKVYRSLAEVPVALDRVLLYLPPAQGLVTLPAVAAPPPREFYVNPGAGSAQLLDEARRLGLVPIEACAILAVGESPERYDD